MCTIKIKQGIHNKLKTLILFLIVSISVCAQHPAATIPGFKFFELNGTSFTNQNLTPGKLSFFVFFDVTCDHCQSAMKQVNQHYQACNKAAIYLISLDNRENIKGFMNKYGPNLVGKKNVTLLQDLHNEFIQKFGPRKYPSLFLYSTQKRLLLYDDNVENMNQFFNKLK